MSNTQIKRSTAAKLCFYIVVSSVILLFAIASSFLIGRSYLSSNNAEGLGYVIFLSHLLAMIPIELLYLASEYPELITNIKDLHWKTRTHNWSAAGIYGNASTWCIVASAGCGFAMSHYSWWMPIFPSFSLLVWHVGMKRVFCEHKGTPHMRQRPPYTTLEEIVSWVADVPILMITVFFYLMTTHFLWLCAFMLALSYTLLVRFGHWFKDYGPMTYLATLAGLAMGCIVIWPWGLLQPDKWASLPSYWIGGATALLSIKHGITKKIPVKERIVSLLFAFAFGGYSIFIWQTGAKLDLSEKHLFNPLNLNSTGTATLLAAFLLPFFGYVSVWTYADVREWLDRGKKEMNSTDDA